ncbi:MAG: PaaI family thioesterase [Alphaproteobacteria bacterium]|nr:PaaI family thioesterase [Alphaproteobacteria bacterium]
MPNENTISDGAATMRSRTVNWVDPRPTAKQALSMTGLDYIRASRDNEVPKAPMAATLGFEITEVDEGRVVFTCTPGEHHYNNIGIVHGGLVSALIDSATGCAVHTTLPKGTGYSTINLSVDMLRPVTDATGTLRVEASVVNRGSRIAIASADVIGDKDGKRYARGQTTCLIFVTEADRR